MQFDLLTIFPEIFDSYINESILGRAQKAGLVNIRAHNIRDYAKDPYKTTDDKPYGGGAGMLMKIEPIYNAVLVASKSKIQIKKNGFSHPKSQRIILLSASGKQFNQKKVKDLTKYKQIILISGRYEGVDARVAKYIADEEISIGPYVLSGGELPSLIIVEAVARLLPGVLGNKESLVEESFNKFQISNFKFQEKEYPQYTRPEVFSPKKGINWKVPKVLLSGDHKKIQEWKIKHQK